MTYVTIKPNNFSFPIFKEITKFLLKQLSFILYMIFVRLLMCYKWHTPPASQVLPYKQYRISLPRSKPAISQRACLMWVIIILLCFLCPCCWKSSLYKQEKRHNPERKEKDVEKTQTDKMSSLKSLSSASVQGHGCSHFCHITMSQKLSINSKSGPRKRYLKLHMKVIKSTLTLNYLLQTIIKHDCSGEWRYTYPLNINRINLTNNASLECHGLKIYGFQQ